MINYNFFQGDTHSVSVAPDFTTFRRNYIRDNVDKGEWKTVQTSPARRSGVLHQSWQRDGSGAGRARRRRGARERAAHVARADKTDLHVVVPLS